MSDSWDAILQDIRDVYPPDHAIELKPTHQQIGHLAHAWFVRVVRTCDAVLALSASGYGAEAWPLRRAALEHVLALRWLAVQGNAAKDVVKRTHGETARRRQESAVAAGWTVADAPIWSEVAADSAAAHGNRRESNMLINTKIRCETYGIPGDHAGWLIETNHSHPGWETAAPYLERSTAQLLIEPLWDGSYRDESTCAHRMLRALTSLSDMAQEGAWAPPIAELAARAHLLDVSGASGLPSRLRLRS